VGAGLVVIEKTMTIALIEAHDAKVAALVISASDSVRIELAHVAVYHVREPERFDIWSHTAVLELDGVDHLVMEGSAETGPHLDDAVVTTDSGEIDNWKELLEPRPLTAVRLIFGSGRTIDIRCRRGQLRLQQQSRYVESWTGPLANP